MANVTLRGHIIVPSAEVEAVTAELTNHIALTRAEQGCIVFEVSKDAANSNRFNVYEEFRDPASFLQHQKRVAASDWGSVTKNVARFNEIEGLD
jgi:(4S)-4-hydroxy-5-phosphonooxypentane-2,3-dione isomerase